MTKKILEYLHSRWAVANLLSFVLASSLAVFLLLGGCSETADDLLGPGLEQSLAEPASDFSIDPDAVVEIDPDGAGVETGGGRLPAYGGRGPTMTVIIENFDKSQDFVAGVASTMAIDSEMDLDVGADAIDANVTIETEVWIKSTNGALNWIQFEFGPTMTFLEPVELRIDESKIASTADARGNYHLWYYNDLTGKWELEDTGDVQSSVVTFEIDHFSKYAVGN